MLATILDASVCPKCLGTGTQRKRFAERGLCDCHYQAYKEPQAQCPYCRGSFQLKGADCFCERICHLERVLPEIYLDANLADFVPEITAFARSWDAGLGGPSGLFITGNVGTGKTHLATAIVSRRILAGLDAQFLSAAEFYLQLRALYRDGGNEAHFFGQFESKRLYVLDDIGSGSLTDFERRALLQFLDIRINDRLRTVITSNWSLGQIGERMDDRIASRLASFQLLEMRGRDRRIATV